MRNIHQLRESIARLVPKVAEGKERDEDCGLEIGGIKQGCQTHFYQVPRQPQGCPQRAKCSFRTV